MIRLQRIDEVGAFLRENELLVTAQRVLGPEHEHTIRLKWARAHSLIGLQRSKEAKSLLRKSIAVSQHALGESDDTTIRMRALYAKALYANPGATLDNLREAVTTLEDSERTIRRVLGSAHPLFGLIERDLQGARALLAARETGATRRVN